MSSPPRKPGPRFRRREAVPAIRDAAVRVIREHGILGLSFRSVARETQPQLSHSAALHHFGTLAGLLGAVAAKEFGQLAAEISVLRRSEPPSTRTLERIARHYAAFALDNPRVYQAIHSPELWSAGKGGGAPLQVHPPGDDALERQRPWIEDAVANRDRAFLEIKGAAQDIAKSGHVRRALRPADIAYMVTALTDGYLFQVLNEQVDTDLPQTKQIAKLGRLIRLALQGGQPDR